MRAWKIVSDKKTYRYILQNSGYLHCSVLYELDHASFVSLARGDSKWKILTLIGQPIRISKDWKDQNCSHAHFMADVHVAVNQICIFNQYKVDNLPQPGFEDLNLNNTYTGVMQKTCSWSS